MKEDSEHSPQTPWPLVFGAAAVGSLGLGFGFLLNRLRTLEATSKAEQARMLAATESLKQRNDQLTSLYNVFSEITETLTLRYVVDTTLREAQKIMGAEMVVIRKLDGDNLVVIGAMADGGIEIKGIDAVSINDDGPTSRAARKGRSLRLDENAELTMGDRRDASAPGSPASQTRRPPLESGVITPLIVGARVVGTMSCWSRAKSHFDADDERLLEMMASSVATAIVASEAVETSSRNAYIDALTDLPNRRQLNEDLHGYLATLASRTSQAVVAMADVDHFKRFNDNHGHKVGDVTLQTVAQVLLREKRDTDFLYRYGGEEFLLIFPDVGLEEAIGIAEHLRAAVEAVPLRIGDAEEVGLITISIGLAALPAHGVRVVDLIELADVAMYQSKTEGRNRVTVWEPGKSLRVA